MRVIDKTFLRSALKMTLARVSKAQLSNMDASRERINSAHVY